MRRSEPTQAEVNERISEMFIEDVLSEGLLQEWLFKSRSTGDLMERLEGLRALALVHGPESLNHDLAEAEDYYSSGDES